MTTVLAQGTFDILHPGHVNYLKQAAVHGDELHVIIARKENVTHKPAPILSNEQRRRMVEALDVVDHAHIGHPEDIFVPLSEIAPDIIILGYDQHHDDEKLRAALRANGFDTEVARAEPADIDCKDAILSSNSIVDRILTTRYSPAVNMRPPSLRSHPL
jgi:FAD synthetase